MRNKPGDVFICVYNLCRDIDSISSNRLFMGIKSTNAIFDSTVVWWDAGDTNFEIKSEDRREKY